MHEVGLAQSVIKVVEEKAREQGEGRVTLLRLRIGTLAGVETESLRFALEVCAQGTRAEGAQVEIVRVPARGRCRACRREWDFQPGEMQCPACASHEIELHGGKDLAIESFDMED